MKFKSFKIFVIPVNSEDLTLNFKLEGIGPKKTSMLVELIIESLGIIQKFGINKVFNLKNSVVSDAVSPKILTLCNSRKFPEDVQSIVVPLRQSLGNLQLSFRERYIDLLRSKRNEFFEIIKTKKILPEMRNGQTVELTGEITRLNKEYNDIGLRIRNRI